MPAKAKAYQLFFLTSIFGHTLYGRYRFRYGWKKQNKMHRKKLHYTFIVS
jgi:hypothetical protein